MEKFHVPDVPTAKCPALLPGSLGDSLEYYHQKLKLSLGLKEGLLTTKTVVKIIG